MTISTHYILRIYIRKLKFPTSFSTSMTYFKLIKFSTYYNLQMTIYKNKIHKNKNIYL